MKKEDKDEVVLKLPPTPRLTLAKVLILLYLSYWYLYGYKKLKIKHNMASYGVEIRRNDFAEAYFWSKVKTFAFWKSYSGYDKVLNILLIIICKFFRVWDLS